MRGRRKTLKISEAEWSIMKVLWDRCTDNERGMTLGEIVAELSTATDWTNTTIRTLIIRLAEKGAVAIDKTIGPIASTARWSPLWNAFLTIPPTGLWRLWSRKAT